MSDDLQAQLRSGGWFGLARDVVRVEGPEAATFLQGQCSQDVAAIDPGDSAWSLLLSPRGKIDAWVRIIHWDTDVFLLDVDPGFAALVMARLERFKLRTKADITHDEAWSFWAVRGPVEVHVEHDAGAAVLALPVWWQGMVGYDLVAPAGTSVHLGVPEVPASVGEAVRVECGVPAMGAELTDSTIPAEVGSWFIEASVSFTKGCYTGQELVARIDSRGGNVARHLSGLVVRSDELIPLGSAVVVDDQVVGEVTSHAISSALGSAIALGYVARSVEPPATGHLRLDDDRIVEASIERLPLVGDE